MSDEYPELAGYEPVPPRRRRRRLLVMRVIVVLGLAGLLIPGVLTTVSVASATAQGTCATYVSYYSRDAARSDARFELFGPGGLGWQCYAISAGGSASFLQPLGLIPSTPKIPRPASSSV